MKYLNTFVWYVSPIAGVAVILMVPAMYFGIPHMPVELQVPVRLFGSAVVLLLIASIPLSTIVEPDLSSWWYRREVKKNIAKLAASGLTPESYLASIPEDDWKQRAEAKIMYGLN